jgi:hypothetical protein
MRVATTVMRTKPDARDRSSRHVSVSMLFLVLVGVALFLGLASSTSHATSLGAVHEDVTAALAVTAADTAEGTMTADEAVDAVAATIDDALLACIVIVLSSLAFVGAMNFTRGRIPRVAGDAERVRAVSSHRGPAPPAVTFIQLSVIRT